MATSQTSTKASQADDKTPEGEDKATSTAAPELREREKVAPAGSEDQTEEERTIAEALRTLGFPEREVKSARVEDGTVIVEHTGGNEYVVPEDGEPTSHPVGEAASWPERPAVNDGANVPPQAVQASSERQDGGSDVLPADIDPEDHARLAELTDPEEAAEARGDILGHSSARKAAVRSESSTGSTLDGAAEDKSGPGASTKGTTDAARARKS